MRARDSGRGLNILEVRESVVGFKVAVRLFVGLLDMTPVGKGRVPAGVNRKLLEWFATAGMKLIGNPAKLVSANFCRLCDLRSREVCLYRAPKDFAGLTAVEPGGRLADGKLLPSTCVRVHYPAKQCQPLFFFV